MTDRSLIQAAMWASRQPADRIGFQSAGAVPLNKWNDNALNDAIHAARVAGDHTRHARLETEARRRGWAGYVNTKQFGG